MFKIGKTLVIIGLQTIPFCIYAESICKPPKLINMSNADQQDLDSLSSATKSCPKRYDDAPCLKSFKKVEQGIYEAICGKPPS